MHFLKEFICSHNPVFETLHVKRDRVFACYNASMNAADVRFYRERWKAVEEIERQELRAMSIEKHWKQLNAIKRFAIRMGWKRGDDDGEMEVFLRWAKLKEGK